MKTVSTFKVQDPSFADKCQRCQTKRCGWAFSHQIQYTSLTRTKPTQTARFAFLTVPLFSYPNRARSPRTRIEKNFSVQYKGPRLKIFPRKNDGAPNKTTPSALGTAKPASSLRPAITASNTSPLHDDARHGDAGCHRHEAEAPDHQPLLRCLSLFLRQRRRGDDGGLGALRVLPRLEEGDGCLRRRVPKRKRMGALGGSMYTRRY